LDRRDAGLDQNPRQDENVNKERSDRYERDRQGQSPDPIRGPVDQDALRGKDAKTRDKNSDKVDEDYGKPAPRERGEDWKHMSQSEREKVKQRELEEDQRAAASQEYQDKLEEAEQRAAEEAEERGDERPEDADKPPEACEEFEGYGEFIVNDDMNIRHQDRRRGDRVALSWEDYQALRDQKIYLQPVPKPEEQERDEIDNTLPESQQTPL
jgi:hypothetical protein